MFEEGLRRSIYIAPARDIKGLLSESHFDSRDFWYETQEPSLRRSDGKQARIPGAFGKFSETPIQIPDFDTESVDRQSQTTVDEVNADQSAADETLPLAGLKVLDFMWVIAGPLFCLLYTSPSPRDKRQSRMPSSA